VYNNRGTRI